MLALKVSIKNEQLVLNHKKLLQNTLTVKCYETFFFNFKTFKGHSRTKRAFPLSRVNLWNYKEGDNYIIPYTMNIHKSIFVL